VFFGRWLPNGWVQANLLTETLNTKKNRTTRRNDRLPKQTGGLEILSS